MEAVSQGADVGLLRDVLVGVGVLFCKRRDEGVVGSKLGHLVNERRDGRREEERLSLASNGVREHLENLFELVAETHVEHSIGFIKNKHPEVLASLAQIESGSIAGEMVEETAWRSDEKVLAIALETLALGADVGSTYDVLHRESALEVGKQHLGLLLDLQRQLASGRENEHGDRRLRWRPRKSAELLNGRNEESKRLARACLCLCQNVLARESGGECRSLNSRHGRERDGRKESVVDLTLEIREPVLGQVDCSVGTGGDGFGRPCRRFGARSCRCLVRVASTLLTTLDAGCCVEAAAAPPRAPPRPRPRPAPRPLPPPGAPRPPPPPRPPRPRPPLPPPLDA